MMPQFPIDDIASQQFQKADRLFRHKILDPQLMCRIASSYAGPEKANHNCLGCNFHELTLDVSGYLLISSKTMVSLSHTFALYVFLLNVIWERMSDVFNIISLPESYRVRHYAPFITARRWANFFKHPKEFGWLVHHPIYTLSGSDHCNEVSGKTDYVYVNESFVKKYYCRDGAKGLAQEFLGKERNVVVVLPDVELLTASICDCLEHFVKVITENPVYHEILGDKATIIDYFDQANVGSKKSAQ